MPAVEMTISESEPQIQNTDKSSAHQDEVFAAKLSAEQQHPEPTEPSIRSTRNRIEPDRFGELIPTNLLKKGGRMFMISIKHQETWKFYQSFENERRNYLTNLVNK